MLRKKFKKGWSDIAPRETKMKKVIVIGSGIAGLSAAACLAKEGFDVTVLEKNATPGGRARKFEVDGFVFDMGPSWYWMPDVFDKFFARFGKKVSDLYALKKLDPSYRIYYAKGDFLDVPSGVPALCNFFESIETGSGRRLLKFLDESAYKYELGMNNLVYKPGASVRELVDIKIVRGLFKFACFQIAIAICQKIFRASAPHQFAGVSRTFSGCGTRKDSGTLQSHELC